MIGEDSLHQIEISKMFTDYATYRHLGKADGIGAAIDCLFEIEDKNHLKACFNVIDNCAIVQGRLYEMALPVLQDILNRLSAVYKTEFNGLPEIIGLLSDISQGYNDEEEVKVGNDVRKKSLALLKKHSYIFLHLIESENRFLRNDSMYILKNCCLYEYDRQFFLEVFEKFSMLCEKYEDFNHWNSIQTGLLHLVKTTYSTADGELPETSSLQEAQGYGLSWTNP